MYFFADLVQTENGPGPNVPPGQGFAELAYFGSGKTALYTARITRAEALNYGLEPVADELAEFLRIAEQYAPALALAREQARHITGDTLSLQPAYTACLRRLLEAQPSAPYFLARAARDEGAYKTRGVSYWIVGYRPERKGREVLWVSRDFFIYQDGLSHFGCDKAFLAQRFASKEAGTEQGTQAVQ